MMKRVQETFRRNGTVRWRRERRILSCFTSRCLICSCSKDRDGLKRVLKFAQRRSLWIMHVPASHVVIEEFAFSVSLSK